MFQITFGDMPPVFVDNVKKTTIGVNPIQAEVEVDWDLAPDLFNGANNTTTQRPTKKYRRYERFLAWIKEKRVAYKELSGTIKLVNFMNDLSTEGHCYKVVSALDHGPYPTLKDLVPSLPKGGYHLIKQKGRKMLHLELTKSKEYSPPKEWLNFRVGASGFSRAPSLWVLMERYKLALFNEGSSVRTPESVLLDCGSHLPNELTDIIYDFMNDSMGRKFMDGNINCGGCQPYARFEHKQGFCYLNCMPQSEKQSAFKSLRFWPTVGMFLDFLYNYRVQVEPFFLLKAAHTNIPGDTFHLLSNEDYFDSAPVASWTFWCRNCCVTTKNIPVFNLNGLCSCGHSMSYESGGDWDLQEPEHYLSRVGGDCGHRQFNGQCPIFCDESLEDGHCLLKAFKTPSSKARAKVLIGKYPTASTVLSYIQTYDDNIQSFTIVGDDLGHVVLEDGYSHEVFQVSLVCPNCKQTAIRNCTYYPVAEVLCLDCQVVLTKLILPLKPLQLVGALDLKSILSMVEDPKDMECIQIPGYVRHQLMAHRDSDHIVITRDGIEYKRMHIASQGLKNMRHDYIASEWESDTDMPLSEIGVIGAESRLTPDCMDVASKFVLELGTVNSNQVRAITTTYWDKMQKYGDIVHNAGGKLFVISVGINRIATNMNIARSTLQTLTSRFMEIQPLESSIKQLCGRDVFRDNDTDDLKLCRIIFENMKLRAVESEMYNIEEIQSFSDPLTKEEESETCKIFSEELMQAKEPPLYSQKTLNKYLQNFSDFNSQKTKKRICNVPMVMPNCDVNHKHIESAGGDLPNWLRSTWQQCINHKLPTEDTLEAQLEVAYSNSLPMMKHKKKSDSTFVLKCTREMERELALRGIGGKAYEDDPEKISKEDLSRKSFHPSTTTADIEIFLDMDQFQPIKNLFVSDSLEQLVELSKTTSTMGKNQESLQIWKNINKTKLIAFAWYMTYLFTELSYNYKHWTGGKTFIKRNLKYGITLLLYNPKDHLFVSYAIPKTSAIVMETGRLGPQMYETSTHFVSDFVSYNEPTIEHFIKAGPYLSSLYIHLKSVEEIGPEDHGEYSDDSMKNIFLLYLNNKTDVEELVTAQRYLFMKLLEDVSPNPWGFVDRFPTVLRSRLTVHYLWRTIRLMEYYSTSRITKVPTFHNDMILYEYGNVKSLFHYGVISLHQKINEFYYGYVISKERGRGSNRMFKVLSKILENEYSMRDSKPPAFCTGKPPKFSSNKSVLKTIAHSFKDTMSERMGDNYKEVIYNRFLEESAHTNFSSLATLKASSRDHSKSLEVPNNLDSKSVKAITSMLNSQNKGEIKKRPKALESIITIVKEFRDKHGRDPSHVIELLPMCLDDLIDKGYFDSDCFAKPQHLGDREIHVLEIRARIVQYFIEKFSKVICGFFPSETTCNPDTKDTFVRDHYIKSRDTLKTFSTHSKSADASKWCQAHHTSHFAAMIEVIAPDQLKPFLLTALSLWPKKRLSFPVDLVSIMIKNKETTAGPLFTRFKKEHETGTGIFTQKLGNKIEIISGMFQGILHATSSLYHLIVQEYMKRIIEIFMKERLMIDSVVSVVEGSDDSGMMISVKGPLSNRIMKLCKTLLLWKERISVYVSIYSNDIKTATGILDLIEYNSEWHSRHKVMKPTFRWVSACMETSVTERFIDRIRIFNNILSQCLEGGASTLECAVVQLNQAALHYILLGALTQPTTPHLVKWYSEAPDPLLGFFPCDFDVCAGVTGVEFSLFCLHKSGKYGKSIQNKLSSSIEMLYIPEEAPSHMQVKDLRSVRLKFCNLRIFQSFIRSLPLESYESAIEKVESDPLILFGRHTTWYEEQPNLVLKVFSPGVRESVSNVSPVLRMAASSAYIQKFPCFTRFDQSGNKQKMSLLSLCKELAESKASVQSIESLFPLHNEYRGVLRSILSLTEDKIYQDVVLKKTSKVKVLVFETAASSFPIMEMVKRRWFGLGHVPLSNSQFEAKWSELRKTYPFISEKPGLQGLRSTCEVLDMNVVEIKAFLESLVLRTRSVTLYDSSSKNRSLNMSLTRIFWPNVKILSSSEREDDLPQLRSKLFSLSTYWSSNDQKAKLVHSWIEHSKTLQQPRANIPTRGQKLKIFHDYLCYKSRKLLVSDIIDLKQGNIGCFTSRQKGWGKSRSGLGVWVGLINGYDCQIFLEGNICTEIRVRRLTESVTVSKSIFNLIKEFNCSVDTTKGAGLRLTASGSFSTGSSGTPVVVDETLQFQYAEIEKFRWSLDLIGQNLRLKVYDTDAKETTGFTILSDSLNSKDWIDECPIENGDDLLRKWSIGDMCSIEELRNSILMYIPSKRSEFLKMLRSMKEQKTGRYNFEAFRQAVINAFKLIDTKVHSEEATPEQMLAIRNQVFSLNFDDDDDFSKLIGDWADEEMDEDKIMFDTTESEDLIMNDAVNLFSSRQTDEPYLNEIDYSRSMPYSIRFFSNLNVLSSSHSSTDFSELVNTVKTRKSNHPGALGKLISLILKEYFISNELDDSIDIVDMGATASILSNSIKSESQLQQLKNDKKGLIENIELIDTLLQTKDGSQGANLIITRKKYSRLLEMIQEDEKQNTNLKYEDVMPAVCEIILSENLKYHKELPSMKSLQVSTLNALLTSVDVPEYEQLPELDKARIQLDLQNKTISLSVVNLIKELFQSKSIFSLFN